MDSLSFRIPEQHTPTKDSFDIRPQALERWVTELPMGDTGEAAQRLYTMLQETNQLKFAAPLRAELLEMVVPAIDSVHSTLLHHYTGLSFPLPQKRIRIAQFSNRLLTEVVVAYQSVLNARENASWLFRMSHHHLWVRSIHRIMVYLNRIIVNYRTIHRPHPAGVWLALHQLYQRAQRDGRTSEKVAAPGETDGHSTIEYEYKKALLLSLLEPQLFRRNQMSEVYETMRFWLKKARLGFAKKRCKSVPAYCIHTDQDTPYTILAEQCDKVCDESELRLLLDMGDLNKSIDKTLARMGDQCCITLPGSKATISRETLQTLNQCWRPPKNERCERLKSDKTVQAAIGMSAVHILLRKEVGIEEADEANDPQVDEMHYLSLEKTKPIPGPATIKAEVWDEIFYGTELKHNAWAKDAEEKNYRFVAARQLNYTETGRCLAFEGKDVESLQVGELIGFRESEESDLQLCMVRWLQDNAGSIHTGLMRLAAKVEPMEVLQHRGEQKRKTGFGCLIGIGEDQCPLIFLPYLPGNQEKSLHISVDNKELLLNLHDKVALSPLFEAYHFTVVTPLEDVSTEEAMPLGELNNRLRRIAHHGDEPSDKTEDCFSDVWRSL
jgi:hypothetical protein